MKLRLGDIHFLNSWPVTYALSAGIVQAPAVIVRGTPTELNRQLLNGLLDVSAVSALAYLQQAPLDRSGLTGQAPLDIAPRVAGCLTGQAEEWLLLPDLAIGSESGVNSVILVSRRPVRELVGQTIGMSAEGATTPALLKILLEQAYGVRAQYVVTGQPFPEVLRSYPAALVIGDAALQAMPAARDDYFVWDLGALWRDWTNLPMVYAVWAVRRSVLETRGALAIELHEALLASKAWGLSHLEEVARAAAAATGFAPGFVTDYFRGIRYELDEAARAGLKRYAELAQVAGLLPSEVSP